MKRFLKILIVVLLAVGGIWFFLARDKTGEITNYPPDGNVIVAFGDSLVSGVGATDGNSFISRVEREIGLPIVNLGRPGDTTARGLARINGVLALEPDVVIVLLGGNDALRQIPMEETKRNLREIIERLQEAGAVTVLAGVRGGIMSDPYADMYRSLARETGSVHVPDVLRGLLGNERYMFDMVHPNDIGHEIIARRLTQSMRVILDN